MIYCDVWTISEAADLQETRGEEKYDFQQNETFTAVSLHKRKRVVGRKWLFAIKKSS